MDAISVCSSLAPIGIDSSPEPGRPGPRRRRWHADVLAGHLVPPAILREGLSENVVFEWQDWLRMESERRELWDRLSSSEHMRLMCLCKRAQVLEAMKHAGLDASQMSKGELDAFIEGLPPSEGEPNFNGPMRQCFYGGD